MSRDHIPLRTQLASMICAWLELPHEEAKSRSEKEIRGLIEFDHFPIRHADGGPAVHWNLRPLLRHDHKVKTKFDAADMAHERKVRQAVDEHAQRMLLKGMGQKPLRRRGWPSRSFPKRSPPRHGRSP